MVPSFPTPYFRPKKVSTMLHNQESRTNFKYNLLILIDVDNDAELNQLKSMIQSKLSIK